MTQDLHREWEIAFKEQKERFMAICEFRAVKTPNPGLTGIKKSLLKSVPWRAGVF